MTPSQKLRSIADSTGLDGIANAIREVADEIEHNNAPSEPFGYFRAEPFGWTDCAADDEGAVALYERPAAPAVPQGYEIHEIPADYSGLVWLEGQVRAVARRAQAATGQQGWTDADSDAARLALELECLLMDTKDLSVVSKWWGSANDALELHRQRFAATQATAPAQEVGLTDEEIEAIAKKHMSTVGDHWCNEDAIRERHAEDFARAIISALRAKGGK